MDTFPRQRGLKRQRPNPSVPPFLLENDHTPASTLPPGRPRSPSLLTRTFQMSSLASSHFMEEETEAQSSWVSGPGPQARVAGRGHEPGSFIEQVPPVTAHSGSWGEPVSPPPSKRYGGGENRCRFHYRTFQCDLGGGVSPLLSASATSPVK